MKFDIRCGALGAGLLVSSLALHARAEPTFPGAIQEAAGIPCTPTCLLCHFTIPGEDSNWHQPFGDAVVANGLKPGEPASLNTVVANLRSKMVDSDGDGKLDVDELAAGTNPNDPAPGAEVCGPQYGCGAHIAPPPPAQRAPIMWWLVTALALAGWVALRRSRRAD